MDPSFGAFEGYPERTSLTLKGSVAEVPVSLAPLDAPYE